jgi:hypothetical protein
MVVFLQKVVVEFRRRQTHEAAAYGIGFAGTKSCDRAGLKHLMS